MIISFLYVVSVGGCFLFAVIFLHLTICSLWACECILCMHFFFRVVVSVVRDFFLLALFDVAVFALVFDGFGRRSHRAIEFAAIFFFMPWQQPASKKICIFSSYMLCFVNVNLKQKRETKTTITAASFFDAYSYSLLHVHTTPRCTNQIGECGNIVYVFIKLYFVWERKHKKKCILSINRYHMDYIIVCMLLYLCTYKAMPTKIS